MTYAASENLLDQLDRTSVDTSGLTGDTDNLLEPDRFDFMLTIRLQARGMTRFSYEGLRQRLCQILDAHTTDWKVSCLDDDDSHFDVAPVSPNLVMADSSKTTLCIQFDTNGRMIRPETIVLIFNVFWQLRASTLMWLRFWVSSEKLSLKKTVPLFMLVRMSNSNSFRQLAAKCAHEILTSSTADQEIEILSGFIYEMIVVSSDDATAVDQYKIMQRLRKMHNRQMQIS